MKDIRFVFEQLNTICVENFSIIGGTTFCYGNYITKTKEALVKLIPYGKVAILCEEKNVEQKAQPLKETLLDSGIKVCIFTEGVALGNDVKVIDEDVRAVVVIGNSLFNFAAKVCTERNLYSLFIVDEFNFDNILNSYYVFEKDDKMVKATLDFDRRVVFDVEKIIDDEEGVALEFAFIMSKLVALVDYRIFGIITGKPTSKKAYNLIKSSVEDTFSIFTTPRSDYLITLIESAIKIRLADAITQGVFLSGSAVDIATKLHADKSAMLFYAKRIAKIYSIAFSSQFDGLATPNYLNIASQVSLKEATSELNVSKWLLHQTELCRNKAREVSLVKEKLYVETSEYLSIFDKAEKTYLALGGKKTLPQRENIIIAGDFYGVFNGMTLVRESGICDYL